jgi:myosin heavy subunit
VYAIGAEAYRCLFENAKNQAIVISGESGAGKTENAKFCMNLLTSIGQYQMFGNEVKSLKLDKSSLDIKTAVMLQSKEAGIEDKILSCNPILEAFGNAKTVRNNNSSRFGKYVRMMVDKQTKKIKGAEIINYLLEKSRICS